MKPLWVLESELSLELTTIFVLKFKNIIFSIIYIFNQCSRPIRMEQSYGSSRWCLERVRKEKRQNVTLCWILVIALIRNFGFKIVRWCRFVSRFELSYIQMVGKQSTRGTSTVSQNGTGINQTRVRRTKTITIPRRSRLDPDIFCPPN